MVNNKDGQKDRKIVTTKIDVWPKYDDKNLTSVTVHSKEKYSRPNSVWGVRYDPKKFLEVNGVKLYPGIYPSGGDHNVYRKVLVTERGECADLRTAMWPKYDDETLPEAAATTDGLEGLAVKYDPDKKYINENHTRFLAVYFDKRTGEEGKILVEII